MECVPVILIGAITAGPISMQGSATLRWQLELIPPNTMLHELCPAMTYKTRHLYWYARDIQTTIYIL